MEYNRIKKIENRVLELETSGVAEAVSDAVAAAAALTVLTDSQGASAADDTLAAVATQTALTDNAAGVAADGTIAAITDLSTSDTYTDAALNAKLQLIRDAVKELSTKTNLLVAAVNLLRQNGTDTAAKVNELIAALEA